MTVRTGLELSMPSDPTYLAENENKKKINFQLLLINEITVVCTAHIP